MAYHQGIKTVQPFATQPPSLQRSYAHEIELPDNPNANVYESCMNVVGGFLGFWGMFPGCFCFPNPFKTVEQGSFLVLVAIIRY
jgi:hypothetical protein